MTAPGGWGTTGGSPWADPSTPTEPGVPYVGPPPTVAPYAAPPAYGYPASQWGAAPQWGAPQWGAPQWAAPGPYGYPLPPRPPQRPGQVITAAVLAFTQSVLVLIASLYLWFFASIAEVASAGIDEVYPPGTTVDALATEGTVLAIVQLVSAVLLVWAGVWALNSRRRAAGVLLVGALVLQVLLAGYWAVRLLTEFGGYEGNGTIITFSLFFAVGPLVGLGMLLVGPGRRWFGSPQQS